MKLKEQTKNIIPIKDLDNWYVVADFDKTITSGASMTSWSILSKSDLVPKQYIKDRDDLYQIYRPIELDTSLDFNTLCKEMYDWFRKHIELFVKYQIKEEIFEQAAEDIRKMEFRNGAREFLKYLYEHNVPVIIISAGVGNFIKSFLKKNGCYYDNIYISSNMIKFTDGIASGVEDNIIHSFNKNEVSLPDDIKEKVKGRHNVVLLGDQTSDLNMVDESKYDTTLKIGFMTEDTEEYRKDYEDAFDILLENDGDYYDILNVVFDEKEEGF